MACLQKAVLCWQTLCLQVCLLLALGLQQVGIWSRNLSRTSLQLPPNQWPTCLKLTKMRWTFLSSKVAGLEVAHWCWSSLPEEGNSFFTQLGPSQPSQWLKKKACRAEVGVNNTSDLKTLIFPMRKKFLILDYSIFFSLHQPWSFFTFEILILCGDFFSIQRFLEGNLFLTKQHLHHLHLPKLEKLPRQTCRRKEGQGVLLEGAGCGVCLEARDRPCEKLEVKARLTWAKARLTQTNTRVRILCQKRCTGCTL